MPIGDNYNRLPHTAYASKGKLAVITPSTGKALKLAQIQYGSSVSGNIKAAVMERLHNTAWKAGQFTNSTGNYTDDTEDAQDAGTGDFPLTTLTNNDGFAVQSITPFNFLCIPVSTAEGGSPVYSYQYWNGTTYATLPVIESASAFTVTDNYVVFHAPIDWAKGGPDGKGYDADKYHIRVRATTAPSTAPLATEIIVGKFIDYTEALAEFGIVSIDYNSNALVLLGGSGLMCYFSTADAANFVEALFREV